MIDHDPNSGRDPVDRLAEEFAQRLRRGERPSPSEYARDHPDLAGEIRDLFPALEMMERLKPSAGEPSGSDGPCAPPHRLERLGDYRILRQVGFGGMGVVYEAVQESLERHVALKILPLHGRESPGLLKRFRLEARSAARLHHSNIVPVFGVGEADGVHYYAMQFIRGTGLDAILTDLRRLKERDSGKDGPPPDPVSSSPEGAFSLAQRLLSGRASPPTGDPGASAGSLGFVLAGVAGSATTVPATAPEFDGTAGPSDPEPTPTDRSELTGPSEAPYYRSVARIGVQVAEALAYAHSQGVLHRDVKPSNLMLDADGHVWVTDFGLAKVEGSEGPTQTGDIVGTLRYMPPERFDGWSDPRSDVYSLGVTLYELLTLRPAFEGPNRARLLEHVLHDPPAPPRAHDPNIPRDLETIVLKAMAKEPSDRYATAQALAEDLTRFLQDRTITARRAGAAERAWRWCRRNPLVAALAASVAALVLALAAGSTATALWLGRSRDKALTNLERAEKAEERLTAQLWNSQVPVVGHFRDLVSATRAATALTVNFATQVVCVDPGTGPCSTMTGPNKSLRIEAAAEVSADSRPLRSAINGSTSPVFNGPGAVASRLSIADKSRRKIAICRSYVRTCLKTASRPKASSCSRREIRRSLLDWSERISDRTGAESSVGLLASSAR